MSKSKSRSKNNGKKVPVKTFKRSILKILIYGFLGFCLLGVLFYFMVRIGAFGHIPTKTELSKVKNYTASQVFSDDNVLLGRYYVENRTNTSIKDVPKFLIQALIATEDARFYQNHGVDWRSTLRVLVKSILLFNKSSGGGSTLTQQLAKNLYPREDLGILTLPVAKIKEITIAHRLDEIYTKPEILELYLNTVPFGDNTYGIETAALVYFNKKTKDLLPEESAMLVGMLKGNSLYNPRINPKEALARRGVVLSQMVHYGYLDKSRAQQIQKRPLKLDYHVINHNEGLAPYFREYLRQYLKEWAENNPKPDGTMYNIYTDGLKIYTTIDSRLQQYAEKAVRAHLSIVQRQFDSYWKGREPWKKNPMLAKTEIMNSARYKSLAKQHLSNEEIMAEMKKPVKTKIFTWQGEKDVTISPLDSVLRLFAMLQTGMISMESHTGYVRAWVGGINYKYFKYDHVTAQRQAGSTFKPIVYAAALENGIKPCEFFKNDSVVYTDYDNWTPRNAEGNYGGYYSVKGALTHSINTVSVKILMKTGFSPVVDLARKMGLQGNIPEVPSMALGTATVSPLELAEAYSVFLNKGKRVTPIMIRRIEDQAGNVLFVQGPQIEDQPLISEQTADEMVAMLKNVVDSGTAQALRTTYGFTNDLAGKTGTTQNYADGWFVGLTPDLITAIWVGGDNPVVGFRSLTFGQGAYLALPIFGRYLQYLYNDELYRGLKSSSFHISPETEAYMDCDDYRAKEYNSIKEFLQKKKESIGDFIRRIFGGKKEKKQEDSE